MEYIRGHAPPRYGVLSYTQRFAPLTCSPGFGYNRPVTLPGRARPQLVPSPRYPRATWRGTSNCWPGHHGRRAVVLHITQGGFESSIRYMRDTGTSSHFVVSTGGSVAQLVSVDDSAWGNGLSWDGAHWVCPHQHIVVPRWGLLANGDPNPNTTTISIEHEGMSGDAQPAAQRQATVDLLVWLAQQFPELAPYQTGRTLIGHGWLDPIDKAFCPGSGIDLDTIATLANARLSPIEPWRRAWAARGIPLDDAQVGWGIPQLYKFHSVDLGACVIPETYLGGGAISVAVFERGLIYFLRATGQAYLGARFPIGV